MIISIRRGQVEDAKDLFYLARQFQTGRESISRDEFDVALDNVLRRRDHETNVLFVAIVSDQVVGYSLLSVSRLLHAPGLTAHLQELVVRDDLRYRGIGDRLVESNEKYCLTRGVRQISASTAKIGSFYNHRGFEPAGEHVRKVLDFL